jgi:hypothetical protein
MMPGGGAFGGGHVVAASVVDWIDGGVVCIGVGDAVGGCGFSVAAPAK